jgi:hypothetical protein
MNRRFLLASAASLCLLMLALSSSAARAQGPTSTPTWTPAPTLAGAGGCGTAFSPCGALPWSIPRIATVALPSPTLIEIYAAPVTPSGGTPTWTPSPTTTPLLDTGPISTLAADTSNLARTLQAQGTQVLVMNDTPVGVTDLAQQFGSNIGGPFAFIRAVQESVGGLGLIGSFITFLFLAIAFVIFVRVAALFGPVILALVRLILNIIQAIKPL